MNPYVRVNKSRREYLCTRVSGKNNWYSAAVCVRLKKIKTKNVYKCRYVKKKEKKKGKVKY